MCLNSVFIYFLAWLFLYCYIFFKLIRSEIKGSIMNKTHSIKNQDIKIQNINIKKPQLKSVRKSFRVKVEKQDNIQAVINGELYQVKDISQEGFSIACHDNTAFIVAQTIKNCDLKLPGDTIKKFTGRVIHFSCGNDKNWRNGFQWIKLDKNSFKKIANLVAQLKDREQKIKKDD